MSQQQSNSSFSASSFSYSSSSSTVDGQTTGHRAMQQTRSDPNGTTVQQSSQNLGEPEIRETRQYDSQGRELLGNSSSAGQSRIQAVSDEEQAERDREYEERIEEEYAKREGGA